MNQLPDIIWESVIITPLTQTTDETNMAKQIAVTMTETVEHEFTFDEAELLAAGVDITDPRAIFRWADNNDRTNYDNPLRFDDAPEYMFTTRED